MRKAQLRSNELSGSIPPQLGTLSNLTSLLLDDNRLSGSIPPELGSLSKLTALNLAINRLTGSIPAELGNLTNLTYIFIASHNRLEGCVPKGLVNVERNDMASLNLPVCSPDVAALMAVYDATNGANWDDNTGWGTLTPVEDWYGVTVDQDDNVTALDLSDNLLRGAVSPQFGNFPKLTTLNLRTNYRLTGAIPAELGNLSNLTTLILATNRLSGPIPPELGRLSNLTTLDLGVSQLSGPIPPELASLSNLTELLLWYNDLTGSIPADLGNLTNLTRLTLNDNKLSGGIPAQLGNLSSLTQLWLKGNPLSGCIFPGVVGGGRSHDLDRLNLPACGPVENTLMALYDATDGDNWNDNTGWGDTSIPLGQWHGVTTDQDGNVIGLDLSGNGLDGTIPADLGDLSNLTTLDLENNRLRGEIPVELSNLTGLAYLNLSGNALTGCVPRALILLEGMDDSLPYCNRNAYILGLFYYAVDGPNWAGVQNWLTAAPLSEWTGITLDEQGRVTGLDLGGKLLNGEIPAELDNLTYLTELSLNNNQLRGAIPAELGNLTNLTSLDLRSNQLSGEIPANLGSLSNLTHLNLGGNQLGGCIPDALNRGTLQIEGVSLDFCDAVRSALVAFYKATSSNTGQAWNLRGGWDTHLPVEQWYGVTTNEAGNVTGLSLSGNNIVGHLNALRVENLPHLTTLDLSDNGLLGNIPAELVRLPNLSTLYLAGNQLTGCILEGLAEVENNDLDELGLPYCADLDNANRRYLAFIYSALGGDDWTNRTGWLSEAPLSEWHGVTTDESGHVVTQLNLRGNGLSGSLPVQMGWLTGLTRLNLSDNELSGAVPANLGDLASLERLNLAGNNLTGPIPSELGGLGSLERLFLAGNDLTGEVPAELGNLRQLTHLTLRGNSLSGCVPDSLSQLVDQDLIDAGLLFCTVRLDKDRISLGIMYDDWGGPGWVNSAGWNTDAPLSEWYGVTTDGDGHVTGLELPNNGLSGEIFATEIINLVHLRTLTLYGNDLTGRIKASVRALNELERLDLGGNALSGSIPRELGALTRLTELWLDDNQFTGNIPSELTDLTITTLHLSGNRLTGCLPDALLAGASSNDFHRLGLPACGP